MGPLQKLRMTFLPKKCLKDVTKVVLKKGSASKSSQNEEEIKRLFPNTYGQPILELFQEEKKPKENISPLKVGVVFSGGQAAGGHNVVSGLFDALKDFHGDSILYGFLNGPSGIVQNKTIEICSSLLKDYRNQGGFDLIGSGRDKIETAEQLQASMHTANKLQLDGLVIIGGDDSNTNAAVLAEYFLQHKISTRVIGVPKTIDGDLRSKDIEISFGFDTACKTYAEMIGNICRDALSAKKYTHFVRLMGRSASHIALECAFLTQPNYTLIGEEVAANKKTLEQIVEDVCELIIRRDKEGKNYGVILVPEGLIEFIPEMKTLIQKLNDILAEKAHGEKIAKQSSIEEIKQILSKLLDQDSFKCFSSLPEKIQQQLLIDRDPHGNVQVSKIETEKLLMEMVKTKLLSKRDFQGKFNPINHFFGYEGRAALPSNFDAQYCYNLGQVASILIQQKCTGYMSCLSNLKEPVHSWQAKGIPITMLMNIETRKAKPKPVIKKYLVSLQNESFQVFSKLRKSWEIEDQYIMSGPIQFFGDKKISDSIPMTM